MSELTYQSEELLSELNSRYNVTKFESRLLDLIDLLMDRIKELEKGKS